MSKILKLSVLSLSVFVLTTQAKPELSFKQELNLNASNLKQIFIDTGNGMLTLKGDNVDNIHVNATIRSKDYNNLAQLEKAFHKKMELSLNQNNSKAILKSLNKKGFFNMGNHNIAIDIEMIIPNTLKVEIDDGSGSMNISNINNSLEIDDGSGSMTISNISGNLTIDDGSGSSNISNIIGDIFIDDGSGSITINGVTGDVTVDDGSGSIFIDNLQGKFHMEDDGSGKVVINGKKWTQK